MTRGIFVFAMLRSDLVLDSGSNRALYLSGGFSSASG